MSAMLLAQTFWSGDKTSLSIFDYFRSMYCLCLTNKILKTTELLYLYKATRLAACWKMRKVSEFTRRVLEMAAVVITDLPAVTSPLGGFPRCKSWWWFWTVPRPLHNVCSIQVNWVTNIFDWLFLNEILLLVWHLQICLDPQIWPLERLKVYVRRSHWVAEP